MGGNGGIVMPTSTASLFFVLVVVLVVHSNVSLGFSPTTPLRPCRIPGASSPLHILVEEGDSVMLEGGEGFKDFYRSLIETDEELETKGEFLAKVERGEVTMPDFYWEQYHTYPEFDAEPWKPDSVEELSRLDPREEFDPDESDYPLIRDSLWDPEKGDDDPNELLTSMYEYLPGPPVDEEGVEMGWDPLDGSSCPFDYRTIVNHAESFLIDSRTRVVPRNDTAPEFLKGDPEVEFNSEIRNFRKSLRIVESYIEPWTKQPYPAHVQKWVGYPEQENIPSRPKHLNYFTKEEDKAEWDKLTPWRAKRLAFQYARSWNCEWLPEGYSESRHNAKTAVFVEKGLRIGTYQKGPIDEEVHKSILPALDVFGNVVELLEIMNEGRSFRFQYWGLIKNKLGMEAWMKQLIEEECLVPCDGVLFESGWRYRDHFREGGDPWWGPH